MSKQQKVNLIARFLIAVGVFWLIRWFGLEAGFAIVVYFILKIVDDKGRAVTKDEKCNGG